MYKSAFFRPRSVSRPPFLLAIAIALLGLGVTLQQTFFTRPVQALSSGVVISQVYGGGGNSGATLTNDFIELFNRGNTPISLNGWSVQYASAAGTTWQVTNLTNVTLAPGQYYLVQEAAGAGGTTPLPAPDATGNIAMALGAGKVALVSNINALTGGCPTGGALVDFVGYGSTASCSETAPTGTTANPTAAVRNNNGCAETDNNSADFTVATPNPRNTNDDFNDCSGSTNPSGVGAANPNSLPPGNPTLLTVSVTPGSNPVSTGITVVGDLTGIGGSATQQFFDNATNGDVTAGDNIFSFQATVGGATSGGVKSLPISIADAQLRNGSTSISVTVQAPSSPTVTGSANPSTVAQGASVILTATVTPGLVPNSTGLAVTGDLSAIGGSATQQFFDDGATGGDTVANNNVFTFTLTVAPATTTGAKSLPISVTDAQARSGSGNISVTVTTPPAAHDPSEHLVMGNPNGATADVGFPDNYLMMKLQYALSYNNTREIPNWTSWHLDSTWRGSAPRQDDFRNDTTLPPGFHQVLGTDYSGSGFDRGHMDPSADRTNTIPDNSATFLMTNMVPQSPDNNQGPWAAMENYLRTFLPGSELYIVSGGVGVGGTGSLGGTTNVLASGVTVPNKTWKVVLILPVGDNDVSRVDANTRTIAVIMPNVQGIRSDQWQKYLATIDQVEALTGYDFFNAVSPAVQSAIESKPDAGNDTAPVTVGQGPLSTPENQNLPVTLSATDFNINNTFTYTIVTPPSHGSMLGSGANPTYSPQANYVGPDSFTFKANDGALDSNTSTVTINVTAGAPVSIPVSVPHVTGPTTSNITVPVAVGLLTGQGVKAYDLQITFDPTVLQPLGTPYDTAGTVSSGMLITPNANNAGHLIISAFQATDLTGSGTLINLKFMIVGAPGQVSPLTLADYTDPGTTFHPGFRFNAGTPAASTTNGSVHVNGPTATPAGIRGQILDGAGQPVGGATVTITGGSRLIRAITDRNGVYQVENLAAGAFYVVMPSRANYTFAPANRAFSLVGNKTDAVFAATSTAPNANPLESPEFFVRQQYLDFLGREPDQGGLDYWSAQLRACGSDLSCASDRRIGVSAAFFVEREFQDTGLFIYNMYRGSLGRRPEQSEYSADRARVVGGATLETEKAEFAASFVARADFVQQYPTTMNAESFVDALLQRAQDTSGLDLSGQRTDLITLYHAGANTTDSRGAVVRNVIEGSAFKQSQYNSAFVLMEYFSYLGRDPDTGGYDFWLNVLSNREPGNYRGMVCAFITSAEYQQRFSPVVTHNNTECGNR
jgi:endonuclease G